MTTETRPPCQVCGKEIPEDRHPRARTCSDPCMVENYRRTQREGSRKYREKIKGIGK